MSKQAVEHFFCSIVLRFSSEQDVKKIEELLSSSSECTLSKSGCLECNISSDKADPLKVLYQEQWQNESIFRQHVGSQEFKHVLAAIDMCCEMPEVKIGKMVTRSGLDSLNEIYFEGLGLPQDIVCGQDESGE